MLQKLAQLTRAVSETDVRCKSNTNVWLNPDSAVDVELALRGCAR